MNKLQLVLKLERLHREFLDAKAGSPQVREIATEIAKLVDDHPWLAGDQLRKSMSWKLILKHAQPGPWIAEEVRHEAKRAERTGRARSREQLVAIGMSRARRAGVKVPKVRS